MRNNQVIAKSFVAAVAAFSLAQAQTGANDGRGMKRQVATEANQIGKFARRRRVGGTRLGALIARLGMAMLLLGISTQGRAGQIEIATVAGFPEDSTGLLNVYDPTVSNYFSTLDADNIGTFGWTYTNTGSVAQTDVSFFVFLDADIDRPTDTSLDDYGEVVSQSLPPGAPSDAIGWTSFQIDEPGFTTGTILDNILNGYLDNTNHVPPGTENDVALALGIYIGTLEPGQSFAATYEISDQDIGGLSQTSVDSDYTIYFNGYATNPATSIPAATPEPATWLLALVGGALLLVARGTRKSSVRLLLGNLRLRSAKPSPRRSVWATLGVKCVVTAGIALVLSVPVKAQIDVIGFDTLQCAEFVENYYAGGLGSLGSGPGPNYGITFSPNAQVLTDASLQLPACASQIANGQNTTNMPSPLNAVIFQSGSAATMNVSGGFTTGLSFYYAAPITAGFINVWSGPNGTGTLLTTLNLPLTPGCPQGPQYCDWQPIGIAFAGTAQSVDFGGATNAIIFDNITLGAATPGSPPSSAVVSNLIARFKDSSVDLVWSPPTLPTSLPLGSSIAVTNPSFELAAPGTPLEPGQIYAYNTSNQPFGWSIGPNCNVSDCLEFVPAGYDGFWTTENGNFSVDMNGLNSPNTVLSQSTSGFTPGKQYALTFGLSANIAWCTPSNPCTLGVTIGNAAGNYTAGLNQMTWSDQTLTFTASSPTLTLVFTDTTPRAPQINGGAAIDNVRINEVLPAPSVSGYNLYRRTGTQPFVLVASGLTGTNYTDSGLKDATTYYYIVRWVNANGVESCDSTEISATPTSLTSQLTHRVPPTILSSPVVLATVGMPYSYPVNAANPNPGDVLTYSLPTAPTGATIDPAQGIISWTPVAAQAGTATIKVLVTDKQGYFASQMYQITVQPTPPTAPPFITSTPPSTGAVGRVYQYQVLANDPNTGAILTDYLTTAPTGMTLVAGSLVQWVPASGQLGPQNVTLTVQDQFGLTASQSFVVTVSPQTGLAPTFLSTPVLTAVATQPYNYQVSVFDPNPGQVPFFGLPNAPAGMTIDPASGLIQWTPTVSQEGPQTVLVGVQDALGGSASQQFTIQVAAPLLPPTITIASPAPNATITQLTNVIGTIADPNGATGGPLTWTLGILKPGATSYTTIASGTGPVTNGVIGQIDPTLLSNNTYPIQITALKGPYTRTANTMYSVAGNLKLGNFTAQFTDLSIPVAGIPITITRRYDSLDTSTGEFGAGWRLALPGQVSDSAGGQAYTVLTRIYVTRPDGKREGFTFAPVYTGSIFLPVWSPAFTPDPGVTDTLSVPYDTLFYANGGFYDAVGAYLPTLFTLTTTQGIQYQIDENAGLQLITDTNGNTLTVTLGGLISSTGVSVAFQRDTQNRIIKITEPGSSPARFNMPTISTETS